MGRREKMKEATDFLRLVQTQDATAGVSPSLSLADGAGGVPSAAREPAGSVVVVDGEAVAQPLRTTATRTASGSRAARCMVR